MIRILVRVADYAEMTAHGGGYLHTFKTVEVESPELEKLLRLNYSNRAHAEVIGAEVVLPKEGA